MKRGKKSGAKRSSPKHSLSLPDLDQARSADLNSLPSKEFQRGYRHAIDEFVAWYCSEPRLSLSKAVVTRYRIHLESRELAPGTINGRLAGFPCRVAGDSLGIQLNSRVRKDTSPGRSRAACSEAKQHPAAKRA
jgi:hypothetical protein